MLGEFLLFLIIFLPAMFIGGAVINFVVSMITNNVDEDRDWPYILAGLVAFFGIGYLLPG